MSLVNQFMTRSRREFLTSSLKGLFMSRTLWLLSVVALGLLAAVPGCSRQQWLITFENKSTVPCSLAITLEADGSRTASVADVTSGKVLTLIAGDRPTVVQTVKVVRDGEEQVLAPKTALPIGKKYAIVIGEDGKLAAAIKY